MSGRPRMLDLFCGAGGAAAGYHRAGFDVVGVDIAPQPHYPFQFWRGDALGFMWETGIKFDAIHASPPCQAYSTLNARQNKTYPDTYKRVRDALETTGLPWVIENVIGAPYRSGVVLCGSMFGLKVRRHRNFESSLVLYPPGPCEHKRQGRPLGVYGDGGGGQMTRGFKAHKKDWADLMGMPWATPKEIGQAVPPVYTEWVGSQLLAALECEV